MEHELDGLEIAAEEAVCNEPCKCRHADGLQVYYDSIVDAMLKSAKRCIPKGKGSSGKKLGWNDELKDLKRVAQSDYVRWRNAGKPHGNDLYKAMCSSRCHFKRGLAESRRHDRDLPYSKLATDLNTNSQSDFWSKVKHGLYPGHSNNTLRVGECTTDVSVLDLWKCHFSGIINSEPLENVERERILLEEALQSKMRTERPPWWCVEVHFGEVEKAIKYLKLQKVKALTVYNLNILDMEDHVYPSTWASRSPHSFDTRLYRTNFLNHTSYPLSKTSVVTCPVRKTTAALPFHQ